MFGLQLKKKGICQFLVFTCLREVRHKFGKKTNCHYYGETKWQHRNFCYVLSVSLNSDLPATNSYLPLEGLNSRGLWVALQPALGSPHAVSLYVPSPCLFHLLLTDEYFPRKRSGFMRTGPLQNPRGPTQNENSGLLVQKWLGISGWQHQGIEPNAGPLWAWGPVQLHRLHTQEAGRVHSHSQRGPEGPCAWSPHWAKTTRVGCPSLNLGFSAALFLLARSVL